MPRVEGKVALVTGGASGLGFACAEMLAREGARVAISDIDEAGGTAAAKRLGGGAIFVPHDVTGETDWLAALSAVRAAFGSLNILVNSAGIALNANVEETNVGRLAPGSRGRSGRRVPWLQARDRVHRRIARRLHREYLVGVGHRRRP